MATLDESPGFRRRFRIEPAPGVVRCAVEDDFHCMAVVVRHADGIATRIEAEMMRAPWTTCPGAVEVVQRVFTGVALEAFKRHGEKTEHCTHLHDLVVLAAAHAGDAEPMVYDILVSDPVDGSRDAELRRNGEHVIGWTESGFRITAPAEMAGTKLFEMGPWLASLPTGLREPARLLRWGNMLANGRVIPIEQQSDARRMPPNCFTFQPARAAAAKRVGLIRDFSKGGVQPLERRTT